MEIRLIPHFLVFLLSGRLVSSLLLFLNLVLLQVTAMIGTFSYDSTQSHILLTHIVDLFQLQQVVTTRTNHRNELLCLENRRRTEKDLGQLNTKFSFRVHLLYNAMSDD